MSKIALKSLLGHKLRLLITTIAIVLGVGFMAGTFVLTDTLEKTFDDLFENVNEGTDALIRQKSAFEGTSQDGGAGIRGDLDPALLDVIREAPGVDAADVVVFTVASVATEDGEAVNDAAAAPQFGFNASEDDRFNPYEVVEGKAPTGSDQVMIDRATAKKGKISVGDTIKVFSLTEPFEAEVTGIVAFDGEDSLAGASAVIMDTEGALRRFTPNGKVQQIVVAAQSGVSQEEVVQNLRAVLPDNVEAITGAASTEESQDQLQEGLQIFNTVLAGFAGVALLAGTFLIYNTFGIIIAQRTRELALLRALGARRSQVRWSVLGEAAVIGLVASILGLFAGIGLAIGLKALFGAVGFDLPSTAAVLKPRTIVVSLVVGLLTTTLSALAPAWRASRVAPVEAMRAAAVETPRVSKVRIAVGVILLLLGGALLVSGASGKTLPPLAFGAVLLFLASVVLGPPLAKLVTGVVGRAVPGITGRLARDNVARNPKRSANTATSLVIGLGVVTIFTVFSTSFGASINAAVESGFRADFQVSSGGFGLGGISPAFAEQARELDGVEAVSGIRRGSVQISERTEPKTRAIFGVSAADVEQVLDLGIEEGSLTDLGPDTIAVDRATVDENGWKMGDVLDVTYADGSQHQHEIAAIYEDGGVVAQNNDGHFVVDMSVYAASQPSASQVDNRILVKAADGVAVDSVRTELEGLGKDFGSPEVQDLGEVQDAQTTQINQQLGFLVILLAMAILIGFIGIFNTLLLSVLERTREIGLLRAVGMARGQVARMVLAESVLVSLLGSILGFVIGLSVGSALMLAIRDELPTARISLPIPVLIIYGLVALIGGTAAGLLPAFRASRLNVLTAIAAD